MTKFADRFRAAKSSNEKIEMLYQELGADCSEDDIAKALNIPRSRVEFLLFYLGVTRTDDLN